MVPRRDLLTMSNILIMCAMLQTASTGTHTCFLTAVGRRWSLELRKPGPYAQDLNGLSVSSRSSRGALSFARRPTSTGKTLQTMLDHRSAYSSTTGIPNDDGEKSKHAAKFDDMLATVKGLGMAKVMCIEDEITRKVITGLVDGSKLPPVEQAFRILYEDYPPIRLAGNLIFDMIDRAVWSCETIEWQGDPVENEDALLNARNLFSIADLDASGRLDQRELRSFLAKLCQLGWTVEVDERLKEVAMNMAEADEGADGITFAAFASGAADLLKMPEDKQQQMISQLSIAWKRTNNQEGEREGAREGNGAWGWDWGKKEKYDKKFKEMLKTVDEWSEIYNNSAPSSSSRLKLVLEGTMTGASCPSLVEALRCVYLEYGPLRMGGDLIFSILKTVINKPP